MSIYIYKIWNYRTVTHPHRTKFEKHDFFDLFNDYKVRILLCEISVTLYILIFDIQRI